MIVVVLERGEAIFKNSTRGDLILLILIFVFKYRVDSKNRKFYQISKHEEGME